MWCTARLYHKIVSWQDSKSSLTQEIICVKLKKDTRKLYLFITRLFVQDYHRYDTRYLHYIVKNLASNLTQESEDQTRFININEPQEYWQDCLPQECSQDWSQILCHFLYRLLWGKSGKPDVLRDTNEYLEAAIF